MQDILVASPITRISDADIIPEDIQNRLMYWRDVFQAGNFDIGDIAHNLCMQSAAKGLQVTQERIFRAVGAFCGKSGRTVRYYCETARFYPSGVRQEYHMLSFSHFVLARYMGDKWREVLDYARDHPNITEDNLRLAFTVFAEVAPETIDEPGQVFAGVATDQTDFDTKHNITATLPISSKYVRVISAFSGVLEQLETVLRWTRFSDETQRKIARLMQEFRDLIPELAKELDKE